MTPSKARAEMSDKDCLATIDFLVSVNEDPTPKEMEQIIHDVYATAHSHRKGHSCYSVHGDWRKRAKELLKLAKKEKFL